MKLKEMVELVQQHHSDLGVTEIVKMLNTAQEEYSQRTRMLERATQFDLDGNNAQRYYALDESILEIKSVDMEGCLLYTSPSPRDLSTSRMPSSA